MLLLANSASQGAKLKTLKSALAPLFLTLVSGDLYRRLPLSPLHSEALIQIFWGIGAAEAVSAAVPQRLWNQGAWALADFMPVC